MVLCLHIKIVLLDGCMILTLISMTRHYGCAESCPMHDSGLLHWGVLLGSPEADLLQLASFMWIFLLCDDGNEWHEGVWINFPCVV